jgi:hypothetical protein
MDPAIGSNDERAEHPALHSGIVFGGRICALTIYKLKHGTITTGKLRLLINIIAEICVHFGNSAPMNLHGMICYYTTGLCISIKSGCQT